MRVESAAEWPDSRFELPPRFAMAERRMSGRAIDAWAAGGQGPVRGFEANSILILEPGGMARIESLGDEVAATFALAAGMALEGRDGLGAELRAACDLIALYGRPVPFEASLAAPGRACVLARGVALPIAETPPEPAPHRPPAIERVQVILSWREVLDRAATARLKRELTAALREARPQPLTTDPFLPKQR